MPTPDDIRPGATPHDPPCPSCRPHPWHLLPCDECGCDHPPIPGIDNGGFVAALPCWCPDHPDHPASVQCPTREHWLDVEDSELED